MEEKVYYESTDNIKLCGLLSKVNENKKIVLVCHGLNGSKNSDNYDYFVERLQNENINSFRFDFRAHGESEGIDYEMTPSKELNDLEKTLDYLIDKGFNEFIILGSSFGASIMSLLDYNKYSCVKGLISWYGALDYLATIEKEGYLTEEHKKQAEKNGYFEIKSRRKGTIFKIGMDLYKEAYELIPYKSLINVNLPILFIHGLNDSMVPYELSIKVSKLCKNSKLELIENGEHSFPEENAKNKAIDVSIRFIKEIL